MAMKKPITLKDLQAYVKEKKYNRKHNQKYFLKLIEEVGELAEMIKDDNRWETNKAKDIKNTMEEEIADVLFYLAALANVYDVDLEASFLKKEKIR